MRTAITLAIHKGGELVQMVAGPLTPIQDQRAMFKEASQSRTHPEFERIELWLSQGGIEKHHDYSGDPKTVVSSAPTKIPPAELTRERVEAHQRPEPEPPAQALEADEAEEAAEFETGKPSDAKSKKRR